MKQTLTAPCFLDVVAANYSLASVVAAEVNTEARTVRYFTTHAHAASAIRIVAERKGLDVSIAEPTTVFGEYVVTITGFAGDTPADTLHSRWLKTMKPRANRSVWRD